MAVLKAVLLLLPMCYCRTFVHVIPHSVGYLADHLSPTADIQDTVIHFGPGTTGELLLSVPFLARGSSFIIELGINNEYPNQHDHHLKVGVSDGSNSNLFHIVDVQDYKNNPPCYPIGPNVVQTRVSGKVPRTFKMTITPRMKLGTCETAHGGGYMNLGYFENQLDDFNLLFLQLFRGDAHENYYIHYIKLETLEAM